MTTLTGRLLSDSVTYQQEVAATQALQAAVAAFGQKFDPTTILAWAASLPDVNGGAPPAGPAFYFDGGILKFVKGS